MMKTCEACGRDVEEKEMISMTRDGVTHLFCGRHEVTIKPDGTLEVAEKELPSHVQIEEKTARFLEVLKAREPGLLSWRESRHKLGSELYEMLGAVLDKGQYAVGQRVAPGLIVVHEDTLELLREQADAKNDLRAELKKQDEAVENRDKVLVEVDSNLGAIVHRFASRLPDDLVRDLQETLKKVQNYSR